MVDWRGTIEGQRVMRATVQHILDESFQNEIFKKIVPQRVS